MILNQDKCHFLVSVSPEHLWINVGEHVMKSKKSEYFPSYELITHSDLGDWRFESNLRSVSSNGVRYVMRHGFDEAMEKADHQNKFDEFFDFQYFRVPGKNASHPSLCSAESATSCISRSNC